MKMRILAGMLLVSAITLADPSATEQQLIDAENAWSQAYMSSDVSALDKLFASEYLLTDNDGATFTRDQDMGSVRAGEFKMTSFKLGDLKVHVYGDFATVTGVNDFVGTYKGKDASCRCRFTDVFVKRDGRWQAVASHVSRIPTT